VTLKDSIFQASSPLRHATELIPVLKIKDRDDVSALLMFTDGGPDHNCKHLSVQVGLLATFLLGGMDTMVVLRTAPQQSWTNPAERIMSVLNLGLQGCSLARTAMDTKFEVTMRRCNGMNAIRRAAISSRMALASARDMAQEASAPEGLVPDGLVTPVPLSPSVPSVLLPAPERETSSSVSSPPEGETTMPEETIGPAIEFLGVPPEGESNDAQVPESIDHIIPVEQQKVASAIGAVPDVRGLVVNEDDGFVFSDSNDVV
jgi:hypothetical protein